MRPRRVADHANPIRVETEFGCLGAHKLHRGPAIADHPRPSLHTRSHQPVFDRKDGITMLGEIAAPVAIEFAVAELPAAAMRGDQYRYLAHALGQIKVAEQLY